MSDTFECHKLAMQLLGPSARLELRVETDDDGTQYQVAEAYTSPVHGNAPEASRVTRVIDRAPYAPHKGQVPAFEALAVKLQEEIARAQAPAAPAEEPAAEAADGELVLDEEPDAEPSLEALDDAPAAD